MFPTGDTLGAWDGWWIEVRCSCGRGAAIPVRLLARRLGAEARLPDVAPRLRCDGCGARPPTEAALVERPDAEGSGFVGGGPVRRREIPSGSS